MAPFVIRRIVHVPADRVWAVLSDFANHGRAVPLTRVTADPGEPAVGWSFTAVTGVGAAALKDRMTIDLWEPLDPAEPHRPARYRVTKQGPVLGGWANVQVTPLGGVIGPHACEVTWVEEIVLRVPVLGKALAPLLDPIGRAAFAHAVDAMLADAGRASA